MSQKQKAMYEDYNNNQISEYKLNEIAEIASVGSTCSFVTFKDGTAEYVREDISDLYYITDLFDQEGISYYIKFLDNDGNEIEQREECEWKINLVD